MEQGIVPLPQIFQEAGGAGRLLPIGEPTPLASDDMNERVSDGRKAAAQIASELLRGERGDRLENPVVLPTVILVQEMNVVFRHGGSRCMTILYRCRVIGSFGKVRIRRMRRDACMFGFLGLVLAGLGGCSSEPAGKESKMAGAALQQIKGKTQVSADPTNSADAALNAGGPSVYLLDGLKRYRLFLKTAVPVDPGKEYIADGIYAQKAIDEIGDPDQGKNGYPLESSCQRVVRTAWSGLSFE